MKFKEFIENCQKFLEEHPEAGEFETIYAKDDEGNGYQGVYFTPSMGVKEEGWISEWVSWENIQEEPDDYDYTKDDLNSVCIN